MTPSMSTDATAAAATPSSTTTTTTSSSSSPACASSAAPAIDLPPAAVPEAEGEAEEAVAAHPAWWPVGQPQTSWYHFTCGQTGRVKCMSAFSPVPIADGRHLWALTHRPHPGWPHARCPACGAVREPGRDVPAPLPDWCNACGAAGLPGWLPVARQTYLTVTWVRFTCDRCRGTCMVGNDLSPSHCLHCLASNTNTALPAAAAHALAPAAGPHHRCALRPSAGLAAHRVAWAPAAHALFPPAHRRRLHRLACVATLEPQAWLPEDLLLEVAAFLPVVDEPAAAPAAGKRPPLPRRWWLAPPVGGDAPPSPAPGDALLDAVDPDVAAAVAGVPDGERPRSRRRLTFSPLPDRPTTPPAA